MSNVSDLMSQTVEKIKQIVDVNTIIGNPIITADGTTLIPVTKITIGLGSGGADIKAKGDVKNNNDGFGGGSAAGVTVNPVAFVCISKGEVKILPINVPANSTADRVVEMVPDVVNKISDMFNKKKDETTPEENTEPEF